MAPGLLPSAGRIGGRRADASDGERNALGVDGDILKPEAGSVEIKDMGKSFDMTMQAL